MKVLEELDPHWMEISAVASRVCGMLEAYIEFSPDHMVECVSCDFLNID
jgi:hypothetical protein